MSRLFEDNDAKAMILVVAIFVGAPILFSMSAPKHPATSMAMEKMPSDKQ